jgi:hypothetical protein
MLPAAAQPGHHCSYRYTEHLSDLLVRKLVDITQQNNVAKLPWDVIKGGQYVLILDVFGNWWLERQSFFEGLLRHRNRFRIKPTPPVVTDFIDQNLEEPGSAICTWFETMERFPRLEISLLNKIVRFGPVSDKVHGRSIKVVEMR